MGWWFLKEHLDWVKLLVVAFGLGGCVLVSGAYDPVTWNANLAGILTGVFSGLSYAAYSLLGRSAAQRGLNPWTALVYTFALAAVFLLVVNLLPGAPLPGAAVRPADLLWLGNSLAGWGMLALLAAGPTVMGFGLYNVSLVYLPSSVVNLIVTLEPAFTAVTAFVLFDEQQPGAVGRQPDDLAGVVFLRVYEGWRVGRTAPSQA